MNPAPCETRLMLLILARLQGLPESYWWRQNVGSARDATGRAVKFGQRGQADILGCVRGRFVAVEVKSASGRLREEQRVFEAQVRAAGGVYILARSLDDAMAPVVAMLRIEP